MAPWRASGSTGLDVTIRLLRRPNPVYEQDGAEGIHRSFAAGQRMTDLGYDIIPLAFFIRWVV
jgi:hypothetical protein